MNTTERSSKDQIIGAACELVDSQAEEINRLEERQVVLWALVGVLSVLLVVSP